MKSENRISARWSSGLWVSVLTQRQAAKKMAGWRCRQKFLPATLRKVAELRAKLNAAGRADCLIQVDGGVNLDNTGALVEAGADVLVSGSAFFGHPPFSERLAAFTAAAR